MSTFDIENSYNLDFVAGIDEAGRGPLCGPVFSACALILDRNSIPTKIDDSKKISEKNREAIFEEILNLEKEHKILFGVGQGSVEEIEQLNVKISSLENENLNNQQQIFELSNLNNKLQIRVNSVHSGNFKLNAFSRKDNNQDLRM